MKRQIQLMNYLILYHCAHDLHVFIFLEVFDVIYITFIQCDIGFMVHDVQFSLPRMSF